MEDFVNNIESPQYDCDIEEAEDALLEEQKKCEAPVAQPQAQLTQTHAPVVEIPAPEGLVSEFPQFDLEIEKAQDAWLEEQFKNEAPVTHPRERHVSVAGPRERHVSVAG
ncbi:hypothetical protein NPIL_79491, partial [Nephila pilipes]